MLLTNGPTFRLAYAFLAYVFRGSWRRSMSAEERGLARFMIRFPEFRYSFARMEGRRFRGLCEEYDLVWEVITKWSQDEHCAMFSFNDYCLLAASIELDAITMAQADPLRATVAEKL